MIHCDIKTCVGCRMCEVACSSGHTGAVAPASARIRVIKLEEIGLDFAIACLSCDEKLCLDCPTGALSASAQGTILLDTGLCTGCEACVELCPIGAVGFYQDRPLFCDLCNGDPACVRVCPTQAISSKDEKVSLAEFLSSTGKPSQKRAAFALAKGASLRECWKNGERVAP